MEPEQVLKVSVKFSHAYLKTFEFYGRMRKDGRVTIPKLTLEMMMQREADPRLENVVLDVELETRRKKQREKRTCAEYTVGQAMFLLLVLG